MATRPTSIRLRSLSQQEEGSNWAFFLVPTLFVAAVFLWCAKAESPVASIPVDDEEEVVEK